jgi:DnaK suppressor protein
MAKKTVPSASKKAAPARKAAAPKAPAKGAGKPARPQKGPAAKKQAARKPAPVKAPAAKNQAAKKAAPVKAVTKPVKPQKDHAVKNLKLTPFLLKQRKHLLDLKDTLLDSMSGVARGNLHSGTETSAFGMHQADAGSDAYDRDFALSMLAKEQGSLYEIDEALKRIEDGTYGICEICQKPIHQARLEALPFTRTTVDCQSELEKRQHHHSIRPHINSLFGLTEEEEEEEGEEEATES